MSNMTQVVTLRLDYQQGPIWLSDVETGEPLTGISVIDADKRINELNLQIATLYNSYYEFNSHNQACWFNAEKELADKDQMLNLVNLLCIRLHEVNDGSFVVKDTITPYLRTL